MSLMTTLTGQSLFRNIEAADCEAVLRILASTSINIDDRDQNGQTFLMVATQRGLVSIVKALIQRDADVNSVDNDNWSALLNAAKEGKVEILRMLLDAGAAIEHRDMGGWTALMWACYKNRRDCVHELINRGCNINITAEHHMMPLMWACGRGYTDVVQLLINAGVKIDVGDKYGTTPLIWAARKGHLPIVKKLLAAGANVNTAGMNSSTALSVAVKGRYTEVVAELLKHKPNVNTTDKDGSSPLRTAISEGLTQVTEMLLNNGAYINQPDKNGDTVLISAVKHKVADIVTLLLTKNANLDVQGHEGNTALYTAVSVGNREIIHALLQLNPDLELATIDGDTALMRAVRNRHSDLVYKLMARGARVSAVDSRGDNALHISLRARSRKITEILLSNPKHSRLLYRANKNGETPYSIDAHHPKSLLTQIFGARQLNEFGDNLLGYDLYSSSLADVLSEPSLRTPITVGLFAKWGSGKSFLLTKLQEEMKSFSHQQPDPHFRIDALVIFMNILISIILGVVAYLASGLWPVGLGTVLGIMLILFASQGLLWVFAERCGWPYSVRLSILVARRLRRLSLLLGILFLNKPRRSLIQHSGIPRPVRFLFTESARVTSVGRETSLTAIVASLFPAIEREYGVLATRLFRIVPTESRSNRSRLRTVCCCVPCLVLIPVLLLSVLTAAVLLYIYRGVSDEPAIHAILITVATILGLSILSSIHRLVFALIAVCRSPRARVMSIARKYDDVKLDGLLQELKVEVSLLARMVQTFDLYTENKTRLVVVIDGLDSCDQEKVVQMLDVVQVLFMETDYPFCAILTLDPHVVTRGIQSNLQPMFQDSSINGFDYLRNIIHLPFYLQSQAAQIQKAWQETFERSTDSRSDLPRSSIFTSGSTNQGFHHDDRRGVWGSSSSNHVMDLSKALSTNDYFSDINPRSMRRLMNIVAITGRLLRANHVTFSWHRLAAWINVTEQWPYRVSWIIWFCEQIDEHLDDSTPLADVYARVESEIPIHRDIEPLLDIDRNEKKLELTLSTSTPILSVADMRKFLSCTINLDPFLRKLIKEYRLTMNDLSGTSMSPQLATLAPNPPSSFHRKLPSSKNLLVSIPESATPTLIAERLRSSRHVLQKQPRQEEQKSQAAISKSDSHTRRQALSILSTKNSLPPLSSMGLFDVKMLVDMLPEVPEELKSKYHEAIQQHYITGLVLADCELSELQQILLMRFGDWNLFKELIVVLRGSEGGKRLIDSSPPKASSVKFQIDRRQGTGAGNRAAMAEELVMENTLLEGALSAMLPQPNSSSASLATETPFFVNMQDIKSNVSERLEHTSTTDNAKDYNSKESSVGFCTAEESHYDQTPPQKQVVVRPSLPKFSAKPDRLQTNETHVLAEVEVHRMKEVDETTSRRKSGEEHLSAAKNVRLLPLATHSIVDNANASDIESEASSSSAKPKASSDTMSEHIPEAKKKCKFSVSPVHEEKSLASPSTLSRIRKQLEGHNDEEK